MSVRQPDGTRVETRLTIARRGEGVGLVTAAEARTFREPTPSDAAALTHAVYRCYGWSYPVQTLYRPERMAAQLESGARIGEAAVTASGALAGRLPARRAQLLVALGD